MKSLILVFGLWGLLRAEPIELTRQQASDLYVALTKIEPGLSPDNVVVAADNINALRPVVDALDKGKIRASRDMELLTAEDRIAKAWAIRDKIDQEAERLVKIEITRIDISMDEIKAAKIAPRDMAPLRLFLRKK